MRDRRFQREMDRKIDSHVTREGATDIELKIEGWDRKRLEEQG